MQNSSPLLDNIREAQRFINLYNSAVHKETDHGPSDYARKIIDYATYAIEYYETLHRYTGDSIDFNSIAVMKEGLDNQKKASGTTTAAGFAKNLNQLANFASNTARSGKTQSFAPLSARGPGPQDLLQKYQTLNARASGTSSTANAQNYSSVPRRETGRSNLGAVAAPSSTSLSRGLTNKSRSTSAIRNNRSVTPRSNAKTLEQGHVHPQKPISSQVVGIEEVNVFI
jgi:hypothetical protein